MDPLLYILYCVLFFRYVPDQGESTDGLSLNVLSINYANGYIYQPVTLNNISTEVPYTGSGLRTLTVASGSSLSFNSPTQISFTKPKVMMMSTYTHYNLRFETAL
jgi:hypothetical protein